MAHAALNVLRILAGLLFMQHGGQKLFALFGFETSMAPFTQMWTAGVLEWFGGLLIVLGLFTRPVAFLLAAEMVVAYFLAHHPQGGVPIENQGELALLYFAIFLFVGTNGGGAFSIDGWWRARKRDKLVE